MQLTNIFCYAIFVIATASLARGYNEKQELENDTKKHIINRREAVLLIDNFPAESIYKHKPKVIYRRVSSPRYSPRPKYGPPRTKYRSAKPPRKSVKKYKKSVPAKYGPPSHKKRPTKTRYGPPIQSHKPVYGPPKKNHHHMFFTSEPEGFGEPPHNIYQDFHTPKLSFGEPPVDSFSSHSKPVYDPYEAAQDFINPTIFDDEALKFGQELKNWNLIQNDQLDSDYAFPQKQTAYLDQEKLFEPLPDDDDSFNSYLDRYKFKDADNHDTNLYERRKKPYYIDSVISVRPRKPQKSRTEAEDVLVGGKYAEPPARIIHKSYINDSPYPDEDDFSSAAGYVDPDIAVSATMSPYVNYKNGNIAFSPQNLNDAFSIVDKK